jgi:hypothetical protein
VQPAPHSRCAVPNARCRTWLRWKWRGSGWHPVTSVLVRRCALCQAHIKLGSDIAQQGILGTGIDTYKLERATIRDNHAHDNIGGGVLVEDGVNVLVENNQIDHNELNAGGEYWDGGIWFDGGHDTKVHCNMIASNHGPGIQISDEDVQYQEASFGYVA